METLGKNHDCSGIEEGFFLTWPSLKINLKLRGTNHTIEVDWGLKFDDNMIMGADVTHPATGNCPSLAAVVATYSADSKLRAHYAGSARMQKARQEVCCLLCD